MRAAQFGSRAILRHQIPRESANLALNGVVLLAVVQHLRALALLADPSVSVTLRPGLVAAHFVTRD